jgi:hypothetical protein
MKKVIKTSQAEKPKMNSASFQEALKVLLAHDPKEDVEYLTLEQCKEISEKIFGDRKRETYFIKRVIDKIENSFAIGKISQEERNQSIVIFNRLTNSNFIRREGNRGEYRYIYKDFWI